MCRHRICILHLHRLPSASEDRLLLLPMPPSTLDPFFPMRATTFFTWLCRSYVGCRDSCGGCFPLPPAPRPEILLCKTTGRRLLCSTKQTILGFSDASHNRERNLFLRAQRGRKVFQGTVQGVSKGRGAEHGRVLGAHLAPQKNVPFWVVTTTSRNQQTHQTKITSVGVKETFRIL